MTYIFFLEARYTCLEIKLGASIPSQLQISMKQAGKREDSKMMNLRAQNNKITYLHVILHDFIFMLPLSIFSKGLQSYFLQIIIKIARQQNNILLLFFPDHLLLCGSNLHPQASKLRLLQQIQSQNILISHNLSWIHPLFPDVLQIGPHSPLIHIPCLTRVPIWPLFLAMVAHDAKTLHLFQNFRINLQQQLSQLVDQMNCLSIAHFSHLIQSVSNESILKKVINQAENHYLIKPLGLQTLSPGSVVLLLNRNFEKTQGLKACLREGEEGLNQTVWVLNEFKLFVWVSVCYAFTQGRDFQKFTQNDYEFLQSLFTRKSTTFLEYHLKSLLKGNKKLKEKWSQEQISLLVKVIREEGFTYKWSEVSYKLFEQSRKRFFRTPQKCREMWFNHLDPIVNRDKWTLEEDLSLFNSVAKFGSKWAMISKIFNNSRTEHMIKNRYHSLMKKYQAKTNRLSTKKLIEKIQEDLFNRMHGIINQELSSFVKLEDESEPSVPDVEMELQPKSNSDTEQPIAKQMKKLRSFDLQQVLFSQTTLEIQEPMRALGEVELIEVEMFADMPGGDEYLSLLQ